MSCRLVCQNWSEGTELAAILFANSNGIQGLHRLSNDIFQSRNQLASLILRHDRAIQRWHNETAMVLNKYAHCHYFEAKICVCPGLTTLKLSSANLLFEDYAAIAQHLTRLHVLEVESSFDDKGMYLIARNFQELEFFDLYQAYEGAFSKAYNPAFTLWTRLYF